jgi:hypothetical protein
MNFQNQDASTIMSGVSAALGRTTQTIQPTQVRIQGTASGVDTFRAEAVDALVHIASQGRRGKPSALAARGPIPIMRQSLVLHGSAAAAQADDHVIADATAQVMASGVNRVGDFVNIMSGVSRILMDDAIVASEASFPYFAEQLPDADSMDPASIGGYGVIDGLDAHTDGTDAKEIKLQEESKGWLQPVHYANDCCMTWMMHSDPIKFNHFLRMLANMTMAGYRTLNRNIIGAIGSNMPTIDGVTFFHANHGNLVVSGGAPSETNLITNRALHAAQRAPGMMSNSGTDPRIVLVPDALKITAAKAFRTFFGTANGTPIANIESSQNYFKDSVMVLADPELDNYSTTAWYSLVDPSAQALRSVVFRFLKGHGPDRALTQYVDHRRRGLVFAIDFVAGWSFSGWRGIVRNPG